MSNIERKNKEKMDTKEKSLSNVYWVISILVICLIITSYFAFFADKKFAESEMIKFITYTSALLSIVLSCFAIVYAYFTSFDTNSKLSSMDSTLKSINAMSNNLNSSHESLRQLVERLSGYIYQMDPELLKNDSNIDKSKIKGNQVSIENEE